jgi:hypothetical protein
VIVLSILCLFNGFFLKILGYAVSDSKMIVNNELGKLGRSLFYGVTHNFVWRDSDYECKTDVSATLRQRRARCSLLKMIYSILFLLLITFIKTNNNNNNGSLYV